MHMYYVCVHVCIYVLCMCALNNELCALRHAESLRDWLVKTWFNMSKTPPNGHYILLLVDKEEVDRKAKVQRETEAKRPEIEKVGEAKRQEIEKKSARKRQEEEKHEEEKQNRQKHIDKIKTFIEEVRVTATSGQVFPL